MVWFWGWICLHSVIMLGKYFTFSSIYGIIVILNSLGSENLISCLNTHGYFLWRYLYCLIHPQKVSYKFYLAMFPLWWKYYYSCGYPLDHQRATPQSFSWRWLACLQHMGHMLSTLIKLRLHRQQNYCKIKLLPSWLHIFCWVP